VVAEDGVALVLVTHDESAAARAQRVVHVADGRLVVPDGVPPAASGDGATTGRRPRRTKQLAG